MQIFKVIDTRTGEDVTDQEFFLVSSVGALWMIKNGGACDAPDYYMVVITK